MPHDDNPKKEPENGDNERGKTQSSPDTAASQDPLAGEAENDEDAPDDLQSLPAELRQVLEPLPKAARRSIVRLSRRLFSAHRGPLPRPADYEHYERVRPGSAEDIMEMAKREQDIREKAVDGRIKNDRRIINVALFGVLGLTAATIVAIWLENSWIAALTVLSHAVVLIVRSRPRHKD